MGRVRPISSNNRLSNRPKASRSCHLWRIAGQYANVSIFDVDSVDELHQLLTSLPLFPYMDIDVTALCRHPSSIHEDDR